MQPQTYLSNLQFQPGASRDGEYLEGFAILGVSFRSGHTLAFRSYERSSIGPAFSSVWMREPGGDWRIFATVPASVSCAHYMRPALADQMEIHEEWLDPQTLRVTIPAIRMEWTTEFSSSRLSNLMPGVVSRVPRWFLASGPGSAMISRAAAALLHAGKLRLRGIVPNGQRFSAQPRALWHVAKSEASIGDFHLGDAVSPGSQCRLADFWISVRPLAMNITGQAISVDGGITLR